MNKYTISSMTDISHFLNFLDESAASLELWGMTLYIILTLNSAIGGASAAKYNPESGATLFLTLPLGKH